jgi:hypothetical protein
LLPRSQGEWGWAKYTGILVAIVKDAWAAISMPWSWVMDPYRCAGRRLMALVSWIATCPGGPVVGNLLEDEESGGAFDQRHYL